MAESRGPHQSRVALPVAVLRVVPTNRRVYPPGEATLNATNVAPLARQEQPAVAHAAPDAPLPEPVPQVEKEPRAGRAPRQRVPEHAGEPRRQLAYQPSQKCVCARF